MNVSELVSGPTVGCRLGAPLDEMAQLMIDEGVGSLAVLDGDRLRGIVTDRDVVRAVAAGLNGGATAADIMTFDPDTIEADVDIADAVDWLNATGYRHLPVAEDGRFAGIVSIKDLLWALADR